MMNPLLHVALSIVLTDSGLSGFIAPAAAQTPPSAGEVTDYRGLHRAAHHGDAAENGEPFAAVVIKDGRIVGECSMPSQQALAEEAAEVLAAWAEKAATRRSRPI